MITTRPLCIDLQCCCGRGAVVTADTYEIALATFRQNGWVVSTADLRAFYRDGMKALPKLYCSQPCWKAKEFITATERLVEEHFGPAKTATDTMIDIEPWTASSRRMVGQITQAIKDANPGTVEKRLRRRRKRR